MKHWQKKHNYNWKLKEKRAEDTVSLNDFPLEIRIKPTAHKQYCYVCRELIEKGERQISMISGMWHRKSDGTFRVCHGEIRSSEQRYFTRHIYLHNGCFSCLLKKMFAKAKISVNADCEVCKKRFDCYTGNLDLGDMVKGYYTPSRACPVMSNKRGYK